MMKRSRETTGTARRAPRHMDGRGTVFELADELRDLRRDLDFTPAIGLQRHWPRPTVFA
jgi:hypothetical protein